MRQRSHFFDIIDNLAIARKEFVREARTLLPGAERNQKRQIASSLKRLIEGESAPARPILIRRTWCH